MFKKRTDLALEAREIWQQSAGETTELAGVDAQTRQRGGCRVTTVRILDRRGAEALGKPAGNYVTVELPREGGEEFLSRAETLAAEIRALLNPKPGQSVMVVGLGNRDITPDAVGPAVAGRVMVTRHLVGGLPEQFGDFRPVSVLTPGVLGVTGIESAQVIRGVAERCRPDSVLVIDALACCRLERLCSTVQLADTGIVPGSGVGNSREAINRETLGVPVLALGVPTVVDAGTLIAELAGGADPEAAEKRAGGGIIVTPRDIDKFVGDISKLLGMSINIALHDNLSADDINAFMS